MSALTFATVVLANPPAPAPANDLDKVQGYWKPLQCETEGKAMMPTDIMKQVTAVFDKSEYFLYFKDSKLDKDGKPIIFRLALANITLDAATAPKAITFEFADGPQKGKKCHGIYELAGNQLKMCYGPVDKPKPTKFESPTGSGYFLETWARQAK
ncbi:TIGR03067 domain-containing protein [Gemmata sp. JC717]|uniref:TIGR03067 domain-containing protein n=1 Tax=Gemmata algarum TaxID=2975278 RepID=A0ABU5F6A0_9BACT|nr:TIGR03067 domain-containing protein [Gemmata algarum]MDY3553771.1 TIGR03067 domain-containing protein [Gemmata algarum]MDY3562275.1 TIGR03067 domain-containing protein [Gemmata algarum]